MKTKTINNCQTRLATNEDFVSLMESIGAEPTAPIKNKRVTQTLTHPDTGELVLRATNEGDNLWALQFNSLVFTN
jgi:hypothetical protein